jgi:ABC-type glycerol-3-phosphate transport system substrate-binding protein
VALSCGRRPAAERPPVEFWASWPPEAVAPLVTRFEAENPGVRVRLRPFSEGVPDDSLLVALRSGHPPDLCQLAGSRMSSWLDGSSLSDWSAGVADLRGALRGWELCMVGDAIYGLPWTLRTPVLVYDKTLFARAGLDSTHAPATWDELRSAAARLDRLPGVHGFGVPNGSARELTRTFLPWVWSGGGELLVAGRDSIPLRARASVQALELLVALGQNGLAAPLDSLEREFRAGRLGMLVADPSLAHSGTRAGRPAGVALVPVPSGTRGASATSATWADGEVLVSFTGSRHKEQALKLARFLVEPENIRELHAAVPSAWPSRVDAESTAWYSEDPTGRVTLRQLAGAHFAPRHREWPVLEARIGEAVWDALSGRTSAFAALASADSFVVSELGSR